MKTQIDFLETHFSFIGRSGRTMIQTTRFFYGRVSRILIVYPDGKSESYFRKFNPFKFPVYLQAGQIIHNLKSTK